MADPWNGSGLPTAAAQRMASTRESGTWSSALSTGEFAAIRSAGFDPVGQVMGSAVYHVGRRGQYWGYHDCLYPDAGRTFVGGYASVALSGRGAPSAALVRVLDEARRSALDRMAAECAALGGDGVVAAQLTMAPFPAQSNCLEFKVIGTAVRARGEVRSPRPFTCHLDGQGFAKLVSAGWVPVELLVGMSVGVRHDDFSARAQSYSWNNFEVPGWSDLVQEVRADARQQLVEQSKHRGGDGIVLASGDLRVWAEPCLRARRRNNDSKQEDHICEATMVGTTIAGFRPRAERQPTLTVMPLNGSKITRIRGRAAK